MLMRANGEQLGRITSLIESGAVRPVVDRIFPFAATNDAMDYLATGHAKGKIVIRVR
jgi:NADPH:quinone reductase-like Zn-dependent oxidoreductase